MYGVTWLWDKQDNSLLLVLQKATIWALMEGQTLEHVHRDRTCTCFCAFINVHSPSTLHLSIIQRSIIHSIWWARQIWNVTSVLEVHFCAALNFPRHLFHYAVRKCKRSLVVVSLLRKLFCCEIKQKYLTSRENNWKVFHTHSTSEVTSMTTVGLFFFGERKNMNCYIFFSFGDGWEQVKDLDSLLCGISEMG